MAMKTKSYSKFMTGAVTAAMVASAVAPVAAQGQDVAADANSSFSDIGPSSSHYTNVMEAKELGFLSGYTDGTFKPNKKLNRGDVAKMLGKYVVATSGLSTADYVKENNIDNVANFADVPNDARDQELVTYSKIVKDAGIFQGSNNNLMATKLMPRDQIAAVLVRAFDLQDKDGNTEVKDGANSGYLEEIEILLENGVSNANPYRPFETTSRAQFASFLVRAYKVSEGMDPEQPLSPIASVNALNDITIKVGETPTLPATVGVTYENGSTGTAKVTWNTDNLDNSKVGTYKLTGDVANTDLEATVNVIVESDTLGEVTEAAITTTVLDDDTDKQFIEFTVNGKKVSVNDLKNVHGYTVQFQATEPVFETDPQANADATQASSTSATGEIAENAIKINDSFDVKIVLTRDGVVTESPLATVKVANLNATPQIGDLAVNNTSKGYTLDSNTLVTGENYKVAGLFSKTGHVIDVSGKPFVYTSSNPAIAQVDKDTGVITPIAPGDVTITATAGNESATVSLTVKNEKRELATATIVGNADLKLAQKAERTVAVSTKDQYGDPIAVESNEVSVIESDKLALTADDFVTPTETVGIGEFDISVNDKAKKGNYAVYLRSEEFTAPLETVNVTVTEGNTVVPKNTKIEPAVIGDLNVNEYTVDGGYVATAGSSVQTAATTVEVTGVAGTYEVAVANPKVAQLSTDAKGNITIEAVKNGKTDITVTLGDMLITKYTATIDIPKIEATGVKFVPVPTVIAEGTTVDINSVLDIEKVSTPGVDDIVNGISLNTITSSFVRIDDGKFVYLDTDDNGKRTSEDVVLGRVMLKSDNITLDPTDVSGRSYTTEAGDKGTLIFTFEKNNGLGSNYIYDEVLASTTVNVDVPGVTVPGATVPEGE